MRFYTTQHRYYCGIDLHARRTYICVPDAEGQNREDLVVAVEYIFTWYWLADPCAQEGIAFVLGHALYMKAMHGGKAKNDRSMRTRSRCSCAAGCCRWPTCTRR